MTTTTLDDAIVSALNDIGRSSTLLELSAVIASESGATPDRIRLSRALHDLRARGVIVLGLIGSRYRWSLPPAPATTT